MSEQLEDCDACKQVGVLKKVPVSFSLESKDKKTKTGDIVENTIKECYTELQEEKDKLKNTLYGEDD